ncbi:MAG: hypothetical protein WKF30_17555 [Pyrinomonadaceae bacterium]
MLALLKVAGRLGGIITLLLLLVTLIRQLISLVGFLLAAIKIGIVIFFVGIFLMIALSIFRDRARKRREAEEI